MTDAPVPSISAVLPAYNEAAVIVDVVRRTDLALAAWGVGDREILVVDDGSDDGTGTLVASLADDGLPVRVLRHERNLGYGAALRSGFDAARKDAIFLMDSDAQFDPADVDLLLARWSPGRAVFGFRRRRCDPVGRRLAHRAFFAVVRALLGRATRDVNCAFKLFPRALGAGLHAQGAVVSTELVLRARRPGYAIVEVGVPHHPRTTGHATGASPKVVLRAFRELWWLYHSRAVLEGPGPVVKPAQA